MGHTVEMKICKYRRDNLLSRHSSYSDFTARHVQTHIESYHRADRHPTRLPCTAPCLLYNIYVRAEIPATYRSK